MSKDSYERTYRTLDDIRRRKEELLESIGQDSTSMQTLWNGVFHKPATLATPSSRLSGMMKTSIGVLDGVLLGWKLYRKLGGGKKKAKKKGLFGLF